MNEVLNATAIRAPFTPFPSISRLSREMVVTEKLDGTNAQIHFDYNGVMCVGSRTRWIMPDDDNYGFARWAYAHEDELRALGPGSHFGEWWGQGIQRKYGLDEKRFSLFNTGRWTSPNNILEPANGDTRCIEVPCCHVVPVLYRGTFDTTWVDTALYALQRLGSAAALGYMNPEGVVVYHEKSRTLFKKTLDKNDGHKGS
jgi:hypothetical protein